MLWDVFISHASEDKASVARPLAAALERAGLRVWIDETQLKVGDSLHQKLGEGLSQSRFGVVVLSPAFFAKPWPQRELGAFFSRTETILPVWHELEASDIASKAPLLADIVAASTREGIERVADQILRVAGSHLARLRGGQAEYTSRLSISTGRIERALEVIESLGNPATWAQLEVTAPGYPASGWMGTDSPALVEILYGFSAPLVEFRQLTYTGRRNLALLEPRSRLQFALLESAFELFTNEVGLATMAPMIEYTPRVPGWREKRRVNPARYWWQGVSPERFDAAVPFFLRSDGAGGGADPLVSASQFHDVYGHAFRSGDEKVQQALGLLANGFYGFRPSTRPVLWRVCVCLARIYNAVLGNCAFDRDSGDLARLDTVLQPRNASCFPFLYEALPETTYEPYPRTLDATLQYLTAAMLPRLRGYLAVPRESESTSAPASA
jgi:hypothetical protein